MLSFHGTNAPTKHDGLDPLTPLAVWELEAKGAGKAWSVDITGRETGSPPRLLSTHSVTHPVPPPVLGIYYPPRPASLTGQHWFPKLVAIVRSPITGLNGNLEGSGKVPRILEARILPGQTVTWEERVSWVDCKNEKRRSQSSGKNLSHQGLPVPVDCSILGSPILGRCRVFHKALVLFLPAHTSLP